MFCYKVKAVWVTPAAAVWQNKGMVGVVKMDAPKPHTFNEGNLLYVSWPGSFCL